MPWVHIFNIYVAMYNFLGLTHAHTHSRREEITEQPQKYKNHPKKTNNSAAVHKTP